MKIVTWNGHDINDEVNYKATLSSNAYSMAAVTPELSKRRGRFPLFGAVTRPERQLDIDIVILDASNVATLARQLESWFDPDDETSKQLIVEDDNGSTDRYVYAICQALDETGAIRKRKYHATLKVDGDVLWRAYTPASEAWEVTGTGDQITITNPGDAPGYPTYTIKPTDAKAAGYSYKKFITVKWNANFPSAGLYPVDICNGGFDAATLIGAGKMQADFDDLRVRVDGVEVDRWLDTTDTANVKVWVNLTFKQKVGFTLKTAIAGSGALTKIEVNEAYDLSSVGGSGILLIGSELFSYNRIQPSTGNFILITRATRGTSMAAHSIGDAVTWIEHDIYIQYGNSSASARTVDSGYEPVFELDASSNTSWVYEEFLEEAKPNRPGQWFRYSRTTASNYWSFRHYGGNEAAAADPYIELGCEALFGTTVGYFVGNVCYITNANFTNGQRQATNDNVNWDRDATGIFSKSDFTDNYKWYREYYITEPTGAGWESWSKNQTITALSTSVMMVVSHNNTYPRDTIWLECADVTLTLNSSYTPTVTIGAEIASQYSIQATITNNTTAESIQIDLNFTIDDSLVIDTANKTVTKLSDGSNQFQAVTVVSGPRRDWLALAVGANVLEYTETGAVGLDITVAYSPRYFI